MSPEQTAALIAASGPVSYGIAAAVKETYWAIVTRLWPDSASAVDDDFTTWPPPIGEPVIEADDFMAVASAAGVEASASDLGTFVIAPHPTLADTLQSWNEAAAGDWTSNIIPLPGIVGPPYDDRDLSEVRALVEAGRINPAYLPDPDGAA